MQRSAFTARTAGAEADSVIVHVQLRPRRGATRRCLAALAQLATAHESVSFAVTGLSKDDRVVRITVGVELGSRAGVARFSPQAQAAYAFVSEIFTSLYDHMPVYTAEPSVADRAAAATLLEAVASGSPVVAGLLDAVDADGVDATSSFFSGASVRTATVPAPRAAGPGERISA